MIGRFSTVCFFFLICSCFRPCFVFAEQATELPADVASAPTAIVEKVNVNPLPNGLAIEIAISAPVIPTSERVTNPDRLVFDFPGCELREANRRIPVNSGPVRELRLSQFSVHPPVTRVVVDSGEPLEFEVKPAGNRVVIEVTFPNAGSVPAVATHPSTPVEADHAAPIGALPKQPQQKIAAESRPRAYSLQAKAKALTLGDLQSLEDKAAAGDPEAQTTLALAYHSGVLLKRDDAEALRLLHRAADHGFMAAQESLGIFSETGIGMEKPAPAEALDWYKKAVQQGSLDAATNIALMYAEGRGVAKDPAQALTWLRQAAEGGDSAAQYNLGLMYGRGDGIPVDYKESVHWLTAAADQNVLPALLGLGEFYMYPPDSIAADVHRAVGYYEKAADLGSALAEAVLGNIFANGLQGKPDYDEAVKWYRKAAEQGQRYGEFGLGVRYELGQGVPVDLQEARRLFTEAAEQGQPDAQYDLGVMCEEAKGAPADRICAAHYYQLAADQGLAKAQFRLGRLLAAGGASESDRVSAYKWLMLAQDSIKESPAALSDLRKYMSEQEIAEAEREVDKWRLAHRGNQR